MELEGNSNAETSAAFLRQLMERHFEPLNVIWDNAPAHRGEAVRAHLATPELRLRPVNPRCHEGRPCPAIAQTSTLMKLGLCAPVGGRQLVPGRQGCGAGQSGRLFRPPSRSSGRSQAAMPDRAPSTGGRTNWKRPN